MTRNSTYTNIRTLFMLLINLRIINHTRATMEEGLKK